jgi:hypothetical protein
MEKYTENIRESSVEIELTNFSLDRRSPLLVLYRKFGLKTPSFKEVEGGFIPLVFLDFGCIFLRFQVAHRQ